MIFIYKKSPVVISPWGALRHGGRNNVSADIREQYLLLTNVDIIHREGAWHYIFEFDARDTLEMSGLGRLTGQPSQYPDDMDWKAWLGDDYQVIDAKVREALLSLPPDNPLIDVSITDMRAVPMPPQYRPAPRPLKTLEHLAERPNFMLAVSST